MTQLDLFAYQPSFQDVSWTRCGTYLIQADCEQPRFICMAYEDIPLRQHLRSSANHLPGVDNYLLSLWKKDIMRMAASGRQMLFEGEPTMIGLLEAELRIAASLELYRRHFLAVRANDPEIEQIVFPLLNACLQMKAEELARRMEAAESDSA